MQTIFWGFCTAFRNITSFPGLCHTGYEAWRLAFIFTVSEDKPDTKEGQ